MLFTKSQKLVEVDALYTQGLINLSLQQAAPAHRLLTPTMNLLLVLNERPWIYYLSLVQKEKKEERVES